jgi:hypothetical protein
MATKLARFLHQITTGRYAPSQRPNPRQQIRREKAMSEHMYKIIELVGSSSESWERAAAAVVESAAKHLKDMRIAEITNLDMQLSEGKVVSYRTKVKVSFKYHPELHGMKD